MNLNCCILENEKIYITSLIEVLQKWGTENNCGLLIESTSCIIDFLKKNNNTTYDVLFIDIILNNNENGIEAAKKVRENSFHGDIVFLTNFQDYVFEGYPVHALDYLLKPASYEKISRCMNQVLERLQGDNFVYRIRDSIIQIPYQNILYLESQNHSIKIVTTEKQYSIPQSFRSILNILPKQFIRCHRSFIVNIMHIEFMNTTEILLFNQIKIPIGRMFLKQLQKHVIQFLRERRHLN